MRRSPHDLPALLALGLVALYLAAGLGWAVPRSFGRLREAAEHARETELSARARLFGADYTVGLESIRQALGEGEPYLLVDAGEPADLAAAWVRYDLAPRPAVYLGRIGQVLPGHPGLHRLEHEPIRHLVVASGKNEAPDYYDRQDFVREIAPGDATAPAGAPSSGAPAASAAPRSAVAPAAPTASAALRSAAPPVSRSASAPRHDGR